MRILLFLSALLTALAGAGPNIAIGATRAHQEAAEAAVARAGVSSAAAGERPASRSARPIDVAAPGIAPEPAPFRATPVYAGRRRV